ncbi:MAG: tetratricopeptide repeat protein [Armatimonas sp.]
MADAAIWSLYFLGGIRAERGTESVEHFRSQKFGFLLAYLATHTSRQHTREELCDLLWPEADLEVGRTNLRTALTSLRRQFGEELIVTQGYTHVQLNTALFTTDVDTFKTELVQAKKTQDIGQYQQALTLYSGPFIPSCYDSWAQTERDRLSELYITAAHQLTQLLEAEDKRDDALQVARRALALDPLRDELHGTVIRLLLRSGEAAQAQKHYDEFARLLDIQLGLEPSEEVRRLLRETTPAPPKLEAAPEPKVAPTPSPPVPVAPLPVPLSRFFGREIEREHIGQELLHNTHLLTLTGTGGTGKTRLAIEVARSVRDEFPQGVHFVPLADVRPTQPLPDAILRAFGHAPSNTPIEQLVSALSGRRLLVLDNAEHVVESVSRLVSELLARLPELRLLVTSRVLLLCEGEREYPLAPLPEPDGTALFVNRVQTIRPDFRPNEGNEAAISAICKRLEGIPLALELAASRAQMLTPAQILERLDQRLDFLVSRKRDAAERHQTLRAAIDWSYKMLDPALQQFFASLSVFRGGWTLEAAEAVCQEPLALDYLAHLRECSLVVVEEAGEVMRYRLLETLREYAQERLTDETRILLFHRHQKFYLEFLRDAENPKTSLDQGQRVKRLEPDYDNLRAAMERCAQESERIGIGLEICYLLWRFWASHGYYTEARKYLTELLSQAENVPALLRAQTLIIRGSMASAQNDYPLALPDLEEGLRLAREIDDKMSIGHALNDLANIHREHGRYEQAQECWEETLRIRQEIGNPRGVAGILNNLGNLCMDHGDEVQSTTYYRQALAINREVGNVTWMAINLNNLGRNRQRSGDYIVARRYYEEALRVRRELNHIPGITSSLINLGSLYLEQNEVERALEMFQEALQRSQEFGRRSYIASLLQNCGYCALQLSEAERGARLLGAAATQLSELGFTQIPTVQAEHEKQLAQARNSLGEEEFENAWREGTALPPDQAIALAMSLSASAT